MSLQNRQNKISAWALGLACLASSVAAQPPLSRTTPVVANPHYASITLQIDVNRPAAEAWKRVGKFCDISESFSLSCKIVSGKGGEFGAVRFLGTAIGYEILVGKTELSYTYAAAVKPGQPYDLYHGTIEARPVTAKTSRLIYTLVFDDSMLGDDAAREKDRAQKIALFTRGLKNMKILAEGGKLPPESSAR
jgi:hypothetical protein